MDLVVIPEKTEHVDYNTKTENPLKCVYKNLHLSDKLEENGGKFKLVKYKVKYLMTIWNQDFLGLSILLKLNVNVIIHFPL